jgi:glycosyltransferase involved in cell wall biosynthesis
MLSLITPAFNEAENLEALHAQVVSTMGTLGQEWEWILVDDHSTDDTFDRIRTLTSGDARIRGLRLASNSGSHLAITAGLHHARGDVAVVMAADLQDPPETVGIMLERWRAGAQVVWATRRTRPGDRSHSSFAAAYYWIMRRLVGLTAMPVRGADFFLVDRIVLEAFARHAEHQVSIFALITAMGFRQDSVEYDKQLRIAGRSGWTTTKKVALVVDSVTAFSALPLRAITGFGVLLVAVGAVCGVWTLAASTGGALSGLVSAMAVFAGLQMAALGVVGEYVWRTLELSRRRPAYLIESVAGLPTVPAGPSGTSKIE